MTSKHEIQISTDQHRSSLQLYSSQNSRSIIIVCIQSFNRSRVTRLRQKISSWIWIHGNVMESSSRFNHADVSRRAKGRNEGERETSSLNVGNPESNKNLKIGSWKDSLGIVAVAVQVEEIDMTVGHSTGGAFQFGSASLISSAWRLRSWPSSKCTAPSISLFVPLLLHPFLNPLQKAAPFFPNS